MLNKENCELLKSNGYRYLVVQKKLNIIREKSNDLKHVVSVYFGFTMSDVLVDIYDLVLDRCLKYEEYKKEWEEVIEHHKKMGCIS